MTECRQHILADMRHDNGLTTQELPPVTSGAVTGKLWKLRLDKEWTVPAVELTGGNASP